MLNVQVQVGVVCWAVAVLLLLAPPPLEPCFVLPSLRLNSPGAFENSALLLVKTAASFAGLRRGWGRRW